MLTKEDKKWMSDKFATKVEIKSLASKKDLTSVKKDVEELKVESKIMQQTLIRLEQGVDESVGLARQTLTIVEGLAGKVADLEQESKMGAVTLHRHGIQIRELATATGVTITK